MRRDTRQCISFGFLFGDDLDLVAWFQDLMTVEDHFGVEIDTFTNLDEITIDDPQCHLAGMKLVSIDEVDQTLSGRDGEHRLAEGRLPRFPSE